MASATAATDRSSAALKGQARTADVTAEATLALSRTDLILEDAQKVLAGRLDETSFAMKEQGKQAQDTAAKTKLASDAAASAGGGFAGLSGPMGAAIAAGVVLSPVLVTVAAGLGGLGLAAYSASKNSAAMSKILTPLKSDVAQFSSSLQPQVLKLFADGIGVAETGLKGLQPVAAATGTALDGVLGQVSATFRGGEWQQFFQFMATTAGPDVKQLGNVLNDLLALTPQLLEGFQQDAQGLLGLTDESLKAVNALSRLEHEASTLGGTATDSSTAIGKLWDAVREAAAAETPAGQLAGLAGILGGTAPKVKASAAALHSLTLSFTEAAPKAGALASDLAILATTTSNSTVALQAFSDLWNQFIGKSVSDQQAILNVQQAFESYTSAVKTSGRTSTTARLAFLQVFTSLQGGLSTLQQNGASVDQLNSFYDLNIGKLEKLHGLSPQQHADIAGLIKDYDAWAGSVTGLSGNTVTAAGVLKNDFLSTLAVTHQLVPQASADTTAFADAILKTGDKSQATAADRAKLIQDLEKSGVSAQQAAQLVTAFQQQIDALKGRTVNVDLTTSGHGEIKIIGTGISARVLNTTTGQVSGGGGHTAAAGLLVPGPGSPTADDKIVRVSAGELIVPTHMVKAGAVDHLRGRIPGFGSGGVVGKVGAAESGIATAESAWGQLASVAFAQAALSAVQKAASGALGGDAAANRALAMAMFPWPSSMWPSFDYLEMREAGYNRFARNAASGAYGIPQALPESKLPFAGQSAGGSHAGPQLSWMYGYIGQVYGNPVNAAAHERAVSWYGNGLDAVFARPTVIGVGERGRERVQVTPLSRGGGGGNTYNVTVNAPAGTHPAQLGKEIVRLLAEYERVNGSSWRS